MTVFQIYLFAVLLPSIATAATITFIITGIIAVSTFVACAADYFNNKSLKKAAVSLAVVSMVSMIIAIPLPSKQDSALMFAGAYASHIDGIEKLPPNAVKLLNQYMESAIKPAK